MKIVSIVHWLSVAAVVGVSAMLFFTKIIPTYLEEGSDGVMNRLNRIPQCDAQNIRKTLQEIFGEVGYRISLLNFDAISEVSGSDTLRVCQIDLGQAGVQGYEITRLANGTDFYVQLQPDEYSSDFE